MNNKKIIYDVLGIGIGPSNLSLAALLHPTSLNYIFLERKEQFFWHEGLLFNESMLQVHYLKDCVTLVDPGNPYSFLQFLSEKKRLYQFLNRKSSNVSRKEFNQYYQWITKKIPQLKFGQTVQTIHYEYNLFTIHTQNNTYFAKHIVIGTGQVPYVPNKFQELLSNKVFHSCEYRTKLAALNTLLPQQIAVIGGGQSGAEIIDQLLLLPTPPANILWASKRLNFHPLEDSCFSNEFYTPSYSQYFYSIPDNDKKKLLTEQILTSDGITESLINAIYKKIYELKFVSELNINIQPIARCNLVQITQQERSYELILHDQTANTYRSYTAEMIVFATGYKSALPTCLNPVKAKLVKDANSKLAIHKDYSIKWQHEQYNKIYIQNGALHSHGIADPNLSLSAWRSAIIINSLLGKPFYDTEPSSPILKHTPFLANKANQQIPESLDIACQI